MTTSSPTPRIRIVTLGCKVNQCDAEEIARALAARGYAVSERGQEAEVYIVNTCTVTGVADAKARKLIRKLAREHPDAKLIVTGCLVQRSPEVIAQLPGITAAVSNTEKAALPGLVASLLPAPEARPRELAPAHTRAFVKLQDGCDHRCAYCAVPDARGAMTSKPLAEAVAEVEQLAARGVPEVVLCGIRLGAYGRDFCRGTACPPEADRPSAGCAPTSDLAVFLHELRQVAVPRVRLSSIEPMDCDDSLLAEIADHPTLCHHLHLPLQSGDDAVLARMRRSYRAEEFAELVARVRRAWPDAALTTDLVVGFPGETDEQFGNSLAFLRAQRFSRVHVFPFSPRAGTPAAALPELPALVTRARTEEALALAARLAQEAAQAWVGRPVSVLFERRDRSGWLRGLTPHYLRLHQQGPAEDVGRIVEVTARSAEAGELLA